MSFDNKDFFNEDFIERSGKKSVSERKIDFPAGKFGNGIRMSFIPAPPDDDNMSGIDLDLITAVIFNTEPGNTMGFNEPFIWGSGRISPKLGSVAFWAKGKLAFAGPLFEQTSISFGRQERDLIGVVVDSTNKLFAYLRDARYVRHEIKSDVTWDENQWNHIVLNWDWANGMELWLNGNKIATSMGTDGWFETAPPGLFHLPASGLIYDELYLMDRPLSPSEIKGLIASNVPPKNESPVYRRTNADFGRISAYSGADRSEHLPVVSPDTALSLTEIWPTDAADGHVSGWYMIDGRNEMAWPHTYAFFTIIPGDGDFHAEKVDVATPSDADVNYVTLTGNLTNVKVQTNLHNGKDTPLLFSVPQGNRFFYGSEVSVAKGTTFRIPFTEKYGTPLDFKGDVRLPLSGQKRIHNIGLYHFSRFPSIKYKPDGDRHTLNYSGDEVVLDQRTRFAMHAITSRDERKIAIASSAAKGALRTVEIGALSRLNIMSEPYQSSTGITGLTLSLPVKTLSSEETLFIRVRDPAIPLRIWNQFAVKLKGFDKSFKRLVLTVQFQDLVLTGGDRLWVDIGTVGKTEILVNDKNNPSEVFIPTVASYRAIDEYARKELISAKAQYSKQYEFMPWQFTGRKVSIEEPFCYGGPFDMIMPALAVHRVKPDDFEANYFIKVSGSEFNSGVRVDPKKTALVNLTDPNGAPAWATYMRDFNKKRWAMADWWVKRQNPDGQVGGGWKDDALFGSMGLDDLEKDGADSLRNMVNCIFDKFELTRLFKDGYCNIYPIDRLHADDIISERYNTIVNNLGVAYPAEREMKAAWRLGKPDQTPVNYNEQIYKSPVNVLNWYWGKDVPDAPYVSKSLDVLTKELQLFTSVFDDFNFYRMTQSNVMRDDFEPYGSTAWSGENNIYTYMLGGARGTRVDAHVRLAVMWPSGGGPDVARVVLRADDSSLDAAVYSFSTELRNLQMRLCRINDGHYKIGLYEDPLGNGKAGAVIWSTEKDVNRFDVVTLPVPPRKSLVIKVEQLKRFERPRELADLAIDPWDAVWKDNAVTAIIHNLGNGKAENITVQLLDGDKILQQKVIDQIAAPADFIARQTSVSFTNVPVSEKLSIVIDPENKIKEILKENNNTTVDTPGVKHADQLLWDIRQNKF